MSQNSSDWTPTPKQAAVLEAAQEAGLNRSISMICEAADVDRRGFYRWLEKDAAFKTAWEDIWRGTIKRHLPGVISAVVAKAQDGDIPAARLFADLAGILTTRVEANVQSKVAVDRSDTKALERFLSEHPEIADPFIDFLFRSDPENAIEGTPGDTR